MPLAARVLIGPALIALTRMSSAAEIGGQVAHGGFQRRLGDAHDIVVRHHPFGAQIGQGQQGAAAAASSAPPRRQTAVNEKAGNIERLEERLARRVEIAAAKVGLVREADGMNQEIEPIPFARQRRRRRRPCSRRRPRRREARAPLPTLSASGRTRRSSASPWKVKASSAPWAAQAAAIPQAMDRSLATPMTRPRLPCIRVPWGGIGAMLAWGLPFVWLPNVVARRAGNGRGCPRRLARPPERGTYGPRKERSHA